MKMEMPSVQVLHEITQVSDWNYFDYSISYPHFISYFQNCRHPLTEHEVVIGISFTYAWMPTILNIYKVKEEKGRLKKCANILNKVKKGENISREEFKTLVETFNNSEVGSSKLLHFIDPELYPIWDSRVKKAINQKGKFDYFDFKEKCIETVNKSSFDNLHDWVLKRTEYANSNFAHSKLRSLDILLFAIGKRNTSLNSTNHRLNISTK